MRPPRESCFRVLELALPHLRVMLSLEGQGEHDMSMHHAIYMRVSTKRQDMASQEPELKRWARSQGDSCWYQDSYTGTSMDRPGFRKLVKDMETGQVDTLVVWRLSTWTGFLYNSGMIRIHLDDATRERLRDLRRKALPPKARDRIEMLTLADAGWSAPRIAAHVGTCGQTVRGMLKDFRAWGIAALYPRRTGPAPDAGRRDRVTEELKGLLAEDRTWTSRQLAEALSGCGVDLGPRQVRRYLKRMKAGYRRTASTLKHKQDPAKAERAGKVLGNLKAKAAAGSVVLYYLDECGFSPTLPMGYSWSLPGQRKFIRYEAPQGRRVNALAAYRPFGRSPRLNVFTAERTWNSYALIGFLKALPWSKAPRVVVLDNASFHTSKMIGAAREGLAHLKIYLYFLPPYSPELNRIEPVFRQVKHQEIPVRSHTTRSGLRDAVEQGFSNYGQKLRRRSPNELLPAA
jgi:putative transposase